MYLTKWMILFFFCLFSTQVKGYTSICKHKQDLKKIPPFTFKEYKNLTNFFASKEEVIDFFAFNKGNTIADIGAGKGDYEGAFSLLFDSLVFYIEDIDQKVLNERILSKTIRHYNKIRTTPQTNRFELCIGDEKSTHLPDMFFDHIIMMSSFHEFTYIDEMIEDFRKKLRQGGKVYILDSPCYAKGHKNYTCDEVIKSMEKHGFRLLKREESKNIPGMYKIIFTI
jgi:ubiquinone/menaquinone biosynthesis C-methylase UbiE